MLIIRSIYASELNIGYQKAFINYNNTYKISNDIIINRIDSKDSKDNQIHIIWDNMIHNDAVYNEIYHVDDHVYTVWITRYILEIEE